MPRRRCLSEGGDIFLKSVYLQGWSEQDVRDSRPETWMSSVDAPVRNETRHLTFLRKFPPGDPHQDAVFRPRWEFVVSQIPPLPPHLPTDSATAGQMDFEIQAVFISLNPGYRSYYYCSITIFLNTSSNIPSQLCQDL